MFLALFTNPAQSDSPVEKCIFFESKRHPKGKGHLLYSLFLINNGTWNYICHFELAIAKNRYLIFSKHLIV